MNLNRPAGPTFARCARVNGTCTTYERIYINKYIYIYKYRENSDNSTDKGGSLRSPINIYTRNLKFAQLVTALASLAQLYMRGATKSVVAKSVIGDGQQNIGEDDGFSPATFSPGGDCRSRNRHLSDSCRAAEEARACPLLTGCSYENCSRSKRCSHGNGAFKLCYNINIIYICRQLFGSCLFLVQCTK